jgi:hypothetical protein
MARRRRSIRLLLPRRYQCSASCAGPDLGRGGSPGPPNPKSSHIQAICWLTYADWDWDKTERNKQTTHMLIDHLLGLDQAWRSHQGVSSFLDRSLLRTRESRRLYPRTTESRCSYPRTTHSGDLGRRCGRNYGTTADGRGKSSLARAPSRRRQFSVDAITNCRRRTRDSQFKLPPLYPLCTII